MVETLHPVCISTLHTTCFHNANKNKLLIAQAYTTETSSIAVHIGLLHCSAQLLYGISELALAGNIVGQLTRRATVAVQSNHPDVEKYQRQRIIQDTCATLM